MLYIILEHGSPGHQVAEKSTRDCITMMNEWLVHLCISYYHQGHKLHTLPRQIMVGSQTGFYGYEWKKKEIILWLNLCSALSWNLNIFLKWQMGCTNNEVWDLFIVHNVWKYIYTVRKLWKFFLKYKMFSEVNYSPKMQKKLIII